MWLLCEIYGNSAINDKYTVTSLGLVTMFQLTKTYSLKLTSYALLDSIKYLICSPVSKLEKYVQI